MREIFKVFTIFNAKEQRYCAVIVFCMLIGAILEAVGIGAILPLISIMGEPNFLEKHAIVREYAAILNIYTHNVLIIASAGALILFYVLKNLYVAWMIRMQMRFTIQNQIVFAGRLMKYYLDKPYLYHVEHNSSTIIRNVNGGSICIFTSILMPVFTLLTELITALVIWSMLILADPFTALIVAGVMGSIMIVLLKAFRRKIAQQGQIQSEYAAVVSKWMYQGLGAIKETKVLRKEAYFLKEFQAAYEKYGDAAGSFSILNQTPRLFIESFVTCGLLVMIISKLLLGQSPQEIVPLLGVLALAAFRLMPCANRIVNLFNGIKFQMPLFRLIYEDLLIIKEQRQRQEKFVSLPESKLDFTRMISVEGLSFQYPQGKKPVFSDISFQIPKGSFAGIIGQSGAGKTTFVDILLGLLQPTSGSINVDGKDIFQDIRAWQANLSYVPQTIYLVDGSVRENIALGIAEKDIDDEKVRKVLKMAELHDFIAQIPEGIHTKVGERGIKLSGGQRQRIGIARALYYEPEVLILDEATSALDNETEKSITETILRLKGTITIIAIAHRVSTLANCDFKIKFNEGKAEIL